MTDDTLATPRPGDLVEIVQPPDYMEHCTCSSCRYRGYRGRIVATEVSPDSGLDLLTVAGIATPFYADELRIVERAQPAGDR